MTAPSKPNSIIWGLRISAILFCVATLAVLLPFVPWLILAAWTAGLTQPMFARLARATRHPNIAGALVIFGLFLVVVGPIVASLIPLTVDALNLAEGVMHSGSGLRALQTIVTQSQDTATPTPSGFLNFEQVIGFTKQYGSRAWDIFAVLSGATVDALLGLFIFFAATFSILLEGHHFSAWVERHMPVQWIQKHFRRLSNTFFETGRGLVISVALTGLVQALVATLAYLVLGVPRAFVLGTLTFFASFIPTVGATLVWFPVAAGLALTGRRVEAVVLVVVGLVVVSSIDNLLKPIFSRWGHLDMHWFVFLIAIFGGLAMVGAWGILVGPLVVRMTVEVLRILHEDAAHDLPTNPL